MQRGISPTARQAAKIVAGDKGVADALDKIMPFFDGPLAIGSGIAGTISDIHQGAPPPDAILGNAIRQGLVYGAGLAGTAATPEFGGVGGPFASYAADKALPPAPRIGHFAAGILGPMEYFDPRYDPTGF